MVTAVLPFYLVSVGGGAASLGAMEGIADLAYSVSKIGGGVLGHRAQRKKPWVAGGYALTALATGAMALARSAAALGALRGVAWIGRGFRGPLRDFMLSDEVASTHYGRAYGLERAADMLGAVTGPLIAVALVSLGAPLATVIAASLVPALLSVASIVALTRDRTGGAREEARAPRAGALARMPRAFWLFLAGVLLFGLGDFSRTFLLLLASRALVAGADGAAPTLTVPVLLYAGHNAISALAAYPIGKLGDRLPKLGVLIAGYALGVATNLLLALGSGSLAVVVLAVATSAVTLAAEETLERATAAERLPRELRSLGFGILAGANAVGDLVSSLYVGAMLDARRAEWAFGAPAAAGALGVAWMIALHLRFMAGSRRAG